MKSNKLGSIMEVFVKSASVKSIRIVNKNIRDIKLSKQCLTAISEVISEKKKREKLDLNLQNILIKANP